MSLYNGPPRGGSRGGRDQFNWDAVKNDKDREFYLGHSLKASVGRWQKGKDLLWYTKKSKNEANSLQEELKAVKAKEEELMLEALGLKPKAAKPVSQPSMDKNELAQLLKKGEDDAEEPDPDRVKGLGYAPGGMNAMGPTHATLASEGLDMPAQRMPGTASGARLPPPPPITTATAKTVKQSTEGISDAERKALKKAAKQAKKAKKEKKEKKPKREKKDKGDKKRKHSTSSSSSSDEEGAPAGWTQANNAMQDTSNGHAGKRPRDEAPHHAPAAHDPRHAKRQRAGEDMDMAEYNDRRYSHHRAAAAVGGAEAVRGQYGHTAARGRHDTPDHHDERYEAGAVDRRTGDRRRHDTPDHYDEQYEAAAVDRRTGDRRSHDTPDRNDRRDADDDHRAQHHKREAGPSEYPSRRHHGHGDETARTGGRQRADREVQHRAGPEERGYGDRGGGQRREGQHHVGREERDYGDRGGGQRREGHDGEDYGGQARGSRPVGEHDGRWGGRHADDPVARHGSEGRHRQRHDTP